MLLLRAVLCMAPLQFINVIVDSGFCGAIPGAVQYHQHSQIYLIFLTSF